MPPYDKIIDFTRYIMIIRNLHISLNFLSVAGEKMFKPWSKIDFGYQTYYRNCHIGKT